MELTWKTLDGMDGHTAGRELLAQMVSPLPQIRKTPNGKPYFENSALHFSISHTAFHAFCCVSLKNVGIDAEEIGRTIDMRLIHRYFSPTEAEKIACSQNPQDALLRLWVLKESYAKLTGRGIGNYLKNTDFSPEDPRIQIIDGCYVAVLEDI